MDHDNNEQDEYIEAPEDDEFGAFEAPENEAPEAVQAMSAPSWVYPDLVRVQANSNTSDNTSADVVQQSQILSSNAASLNRSNFPANGGGPRASQRVLNPPDVSLLSLNSTSSFPGTSQQNSLDLCSSARSNSKLYFQSNLCNLKNGAASSTASPNNVSSPNSTGSSSSASSSIATNLSGLVLSNSSSCSSQQNVESRSNDLNVSITSNGVQENNYLDFNNPTPSTSSSYLASSTVVSNQRLANLEREIRALEMQKVLLQQQLMQKDGQINDLQRTLSAVSNTTSNLEENVMRKINDSFERLNENLENSMGTFQQRIEHLENCFKLGNGTIVQNGQCHSTNESDNDHQNSTDKSYPLLAQSLLAMQSKLCDQQRQELCLLFRNILTSAIQEIDNFGRNSTSSSNPNSSNFNGR